MGNMCSSWLWLSVNCHESQHPSVNPPAPQSSPALLMHHVTCLIQTARYQPFPSTDVRAVIAPQRQPIAFGQINSLRQLYGTRSTPGAIPLKSLGFYTWERCEAYCIKAAFFCLPFICLSVDLKWAPLLMTYLWWVIHLNSGVSLFLNVTSFYTIAPAGMISQ